MPESSAIDKPSKDLILQKWLSRLESPGRKQNFGYLRRMNSNDECGGFCAMGELADVLVANDLGRWKRTAFVSADGTLGLGTLPSPVIAKALRIGELKASVLQNNVVTMNDSGVKFPQIATFIRIFLGPNT